MRQFQINDLVSFRADRDGGQAYGVSVDAVGMVTGVAAAGPEDGAYQIMVKFPKLATTLPYIAAVEYELVEAAAPKRH